MAGWIEKWLGLQPESEQHAQLFTDGLRQGFYAARRDPELTIEKFMADIAKLRTHLKTLSSEELELLSNHFSIQPAIGAHPEK